jgi:hypothetical protein
MGDIASKGTGGGLISANTHGPTKFITPGSMDVQMEGKAVHLLGEPMLNNCGPSGSPPNTGATMAGFDTYESSRADIKKIACDCDKKVKQAPAGKKQKTCSQLGREKHACCEKAIQGPPKAEGIDGEQGYGPKASKPGDPDRAPLTQTRSQIYHAGGGKALRGTCWPDATITGTDGEKKFVDFKFRCPPNTPVRKKTKGGVGLSIKTERLRRKNTKRSARRMASMESQKSSRRRTVPHEVARLDEIRGHHAPGAPRGSARALQFLLGRRLCA